MVRESSYVVYYGKTWRFKSNLSITNQPDHDYSSDTTTLRIADAENHNTLYSVANGDDGVSFSSSGSFSATLDPADVSALEPGTYHIDGTLVWADGEDLFLYGPLIIKPTAS